MNKLLYLTILCCATCFIACDDIFVEDISDDSITIVAPGDGVVLTNSSLTLVWETLEGAESYQVVIVSPSFSDIRSYVCDSVTEDYKMKLTLDPGTYEWSVQGHNSAYASLKSIRKFEIAAP